MGESREGGGSVRQDATDRVARAVALDAVKSERDVSRIVVQRITEGLYTVELTAHGESEPERFLYAEEDLLASETASDSPVAGSTGDGTHG